MVTKKLLSRVFTIQQPGKITQLSWLSSATYLEGKGTVELCFDPALRPFLLRLKERFTSYRLREIIQLKSSFSIRIYELLKQFEKIGTRTFPLSDLKTILGIDKKQYRPYANFKMKVLLVAQAELNEKTDISFDFEEIKVGRGVGKIRFQITAKTLEELNNMDNLGQKLIETASSQPSEEDILVELLQTIYRESASIRKLLIQFLEKSGIAYVARNIEYANAKSNAVTAGSAPGKGSNYRNYLAMALRGDFGLPFKEDLEAAKTVQADNHQKEAELAKAQEEQINRARIDQENMDRAKAYQEKLPEKAVAQLREEAFESLDDQQKSLVLRKTPGSEMLLKLAITRICMARMKTSQLGLFEKEAAA